MRVSIENSGSKGSSSSSDKRSSHSGGHSDKKSSRKSSTLDDKQKIKAAVAVAIIVLAAGWIAYSTGLFDGGAPVSTAAEPTPEQLQELAKQAVQENSESGGGARLNPAMPLGAQ